MSSWSYISKKTTSQLHIEEEDDLPDFVDWEVEGAVNIPRDHTTNTHKVRTPAP
jgi:hypothetical protein